jgi:hypothetical protein
MIIQNRIFYKPWQKNSARKLSWEKWEAERMKTHTNDNN